MATLPDAMRGLNDGGSMPSTAVAGPGSKHERQARRLRRRSAPGVAGRRRESAQRTSVEAAGELGEGGFGGDRIERGGRQGQGLEERRAGGGQERCTCGNGL